MNFEDKVVLKKFVGGGKPNQYIYRNRTLYENAKQHLNNDGWFIVSDKKEIAAFWKIKGHHYPEIKPELVNNDTEPFTEISSQTEKKAKTKNNAKD